MSRLAAVALVGGLAACTSGPSLDTRTFELQYLDPDAAADMIHPYVYSDRPQGDRGMISLAGNLITVRETPDNLDKIARVLEQYDIPSPMAQLHFKIIEADGAIQTDSAIADVETALRRLFSFRGYRLLAQAVLGGLEGSQVGQQVVGGDQEFLIRAHIQDIRGTGDSGTVRLEVMLMPEDERAVFETTVSIGTGQTVVLGSTQPRSSGRTLILAVAAELVNP
jgi:type II secretory pathway component GspD/PulD (secretin)